MPRLPIRLIQPWRTHLQKEGLDPQTLVSGTGISLNQLDCEGETLEWTDFITILRRFHWIMGDTATLEQSYAQTWAPKPWWTAPWNTLRTAEDLARNLRAMFWVPEDPALICHLMHSDRDQAVIHFALTDTCLGDPLLAPFLECLLNTIPASQGLRLTQMESVTSDRGGTFGIKVHPSRITRWQHNIRDLMLMVFNGEKWRARYHSHQIELQESLNETLQAHSRTRTLNLVGLDLAECTDLAELADALARSLNANLLATGMTLSVDSRNPLDLTPTLISRGIPGPHCQTAVLSTAQGRVGELKVWMETEAIHPDLLDEMTPWVAISIQNALAIQTIRDQTAQMAQDFEEAQLAAQAQRELELHLLRTQKLESLGMMAKGVAHDFNNLLVGVLSNAQLAAHGLNTDNPARAHVERIIQTAQQAGRLSEQMLTYSGNKGSVFQNQDLNEMVCGMTELLTASLPKKIHLEFCLTENLPAVDIDIHQLQQVILNLVQNGAEAIGDRKGTVTVQTKRVWPDEFLQSSEVFTNRLPIGEAILLEVTDTGQGITRRSRGRVFDPFFSTRGPGRGLGLSSVMGIVRHHRGALSLQSQTGRGSTFQVLLPLSIEATDSINSPALQTWTPKGNLLLADDEKVVRESLSDMLDLMGFSSRIVEDGDQALQVFMNEQEHFTALILDWNMPGQSGIEVFMQIREIDPHIPVILTSAYKPDERVLALKAQGNVSYLRKPFTMEALRTALELRLAVERRA